MLEVHLGLILWTIVTFVVVLAVLSKTAWKPILEGLKSREAGIRDSLAKAEEAHHEAKRVKEEYTLMVHQAKVDTSKVIEEGKAHAERIKNEMLEEAQRKRELELAKAQAEIEQEKERAMNEIRTMVAGLSVEIASQILRREIDAKAHQDLIDESIAELSRN